MLIHKTSLWLTAAAMFAPAGAAFAADLPVKAAPVAPAYYDWSGVYLGVHAGYGGGMKDWFGDFTADFTARGFLGGGQVGINKQFLGEYQGISDGRLRRAEHRIPVDPSDHFENR